MVFCIREGLCRYHWRVVVYVAFIQGDVGCGAVALRIQCRHAVHTRVRALFEVVHPGSNASRGDRDHACVADLVVAVCTGVGACRCEAVACHRDVVGRGHGAYRRASHLVFCIREGLCRYHWRVVVSTITHPTSLIKRIRKTVTRHRRITRRHRAEFVSKSKVIEIVINSQKINKAKTVTIRRTTRASSSFLDYLTNIFTLFNRFNHSIDSGNIDRGIKCFRHKRFYKLIGKRNQLLRTDMYHLPIG